MSFSAQPSAGTSAAGAGPLSRIPTLSRSGANSRLPSPPVSPGLGSPATPPGTVAGLYTAAAANAVPYGCSGGGGGGVGVGSGLSLGGSGAGAGPGSSYSSGAGTWTAGMLSQGRDRLASSSSSSSLHGLAAAAAAATPGAPPSGLSARSQPSPAPSLPRSGSARTSTSGAALPRPPAPWSSSAGGMAAGGPPALVVPIGLPPGDVDPAGGSGWGEGAASGGGAGLPPPSPGGTGGTRSSIQVAVRMRPLCDKERQRGDRVAWAADREGHVGLLDVGTGSFTAKHRFDTVFGPESSNLDVATAVALPLVGPALAGVNGTIFAYGVTSSGKTHTMMGTAGDPGIVPRVIRELFAQIAGGGPPSSGPRPSDSRSFTYQVRMSVMEIYNEVLNDLLDPGKANLKVREDSRSGVVMVEGLTEVAVGSAEQALDLISRGDHNRKVSATAFNEDSSRSHTITRIVVDSAPAAQASGPSPPFGPAASSRRTSAVLSLIDLAGSESARAVVNKGQRMEGAFINRSLLTLGTVIHKLATTGAAGGAGGHVPFRDSKLTRLLQPSLCGPGARVAVVCNVTPAAAQTDETANTLKFAARAKLVQVTARTNEILDDRTLLRRYQKEVADLRRQLVEARRRMAEAGVGSTSGGAAGGGGPGGAGSPLPPLPGLGGLGGVDEDLQAALQAERDARRSAEMEAVALRIKMERMQTFLEARGVNVDDLLLLQAGDSEGGLPLPLLPAVPASPSGPALPLRPPGSGSPLHLDLSLLDLAATGPGGGSAASSPGPSHHYQQSGGAAAPARHREGEGAAGQQPLPRSPLALAGARGSCRGSGSGSPPRTLLPASAPYSPALGSRGGVAGTAAAGTGGRGAGPCPGPAGMRHAASTHGLSGPEPRVAQSEFEVATALAAAAVMGGAAASGPPQQQQPVPSVVGASGRAPGGAASGGTHSGGGGGSGSQSSGSGLLDDDEELNEGLMAQIRNLISEAQLAPPLGELPGGRGAAAAAVGGPQPGAAAAVGGGAQVPDPSSRGAAAASGTSGIPTARGGAAAAAAAAGPAAALPPPGPSSSGGGGGGAAQQGRLISSGSYGGSSVGGGSIGGSGGMVLFPGAGGAISGGPPSSTLSSCRRSTTFSTTSSGSGGADGDCDLELQLQVLNADREVLYDQLLASEKDNEKLTSQITDLRRQLLTYEQLTRQAASELGEIRRLKEAFQARLQRENEALRAQVTKLGGKPAAPGVLGAASGGDGGDATLGGPGPASPSGRWGAPGSGGGSGRPHGNGSAPAVHPHMAAAAAAMRASLPPQSPTGGAVRSYTAGGLPFGSGGGGGGGGGVDGAGVLMGVAAGAGVSSLSEAGAGVGERRSAAAPTSGWAPSAPSAPQQPQQQCSVLEPMPSFAPVLHPRADSSTIGGGVGASGGGGVSHRIFGGSPGGSLLEAGDPGAFPPSISGRSLVGVPPQQPQAQPQAPQPPGSPSSPEEVLARLQQNLFARMQARESGGGGSPLALRS